MTFRRLLVPAVVLALVIAGCGGGDPATDDKAAGDATRTVNIEMRDIDFDPASLEVKKGETVRFVFTNKGAIRHDAFIGDIAAQADHEKDSRAGDDAGHGGGHDEGDEAITVEPGETGELEHTFSEAGRLQIGCHQAGHYAGGMKVEITVT